jgi:hypothetical protein
MMTWLLVLAISGWQGSTISLFVWLVADDWWFVLREKYCWLVADKPSEHGDEDYDISSEKSSAWARMRGTTGYAAPGKIFNYSCLSIAYISI